jgi:hypothetical protein
MTKSGCVQPPRLALWLVNLFTPSEQAESIPGDLLEEFSELALKSGAEFARRWYWRQSLNTVAHLIGGAFRLAPWRIAGAVIAGRLLFFYGLMLPERAIVAVLRKYPIYPNYDHENVYALWMFWVPLAIQIGWVVVAVSIGCIVAAAVKGKEMVAAMTLALTFVALPLVALIVRGSRSPFSGPPFLRIGLFLVFPLAIVVGGGIVRTIRSAMSSRRYSSPC